MIQQLEGEPSNQPSNIVRVGSTWGVICSFCVRGKLSKSRLSISSPSPKTSDKNCLRLTRGSNPGYALSAQRFLYWLWKFFLLPQGIFRKCIRLKDVFCQLRSSCTDLENFMVGFRQVLSLKDVFCELIGSCTESGHFLIDSKEFLLLKDVFCEFKGSCTDSVNFLIASWK